MNIAFCDDDAVIRTHIRERVCALFAARGIAVNADEYPDAASLASDPQGGCADLLFLDIDLPDGDGIRLAGQLRAAGSRTEIVFVSNMDSRVYEVFDLRPFGFVRKSRFDAEIGAVVDRFVGAALSAPAGSAGGTIVLHGEDGQPLSVRPENILYIESCGKLQNLCYADRVLPVRAVLRELEQVLSPAGFIRIHKGFLVNYRCVKKITSRSVLLDNGTDLPIGRDRLQPARERYLSLMKR